MNNVIRNNATAGRNSAAISIDANSMKSVPVQDQGRETGENGRIAAGLGNYGPLVAGNRLLNDDVNGMRIRGATLTTESIWDDTDIVHVLQSEIVVGNFHTYGGLLLKSQSDESLVVKLGRPASNPNAVVGFTASGTPLDITDRIGGSVQVIGAPGFPVILTSLRDDSIGAGFSSTGDALKDTNNDRAATVPSAGDWRGIRLDQLSNDRNVDTAIELEPDQIQEVGVNDLPSGAQPLGGLATSTQAGDENLRLGFTVRGTIAAPGDLDVYSFVGTAGTQVWIDIDRTDMSLDAIVELVDSAGRIIAQSDNSLTESAASAVAFIDPARITPSRVQAMDSSAFAPQNSLPVAGRIVDTDFQSINPKDPGLRVLLPGASGFPNTYYVRVRSSNVGPNQSPTRLQDESLLRAGISEGSYRLQVRLQQQDEIGGSAIRYADVRFATNGVQIVGLPSHSPLLGTASAVQGATPGASTNLGNLAASDRGAFSLAGEINGRTDVDFYQFSLAKTLTQKSANSHIAVSIDVDYASDFGGPNTSLWLYRRVGNGMQLVLTGTDSNIADDRSAPGQGADLDDLSRGSFGPLDAYIGTQELPRGDYVLAVTNNSLISRELEQYQQANPLNPAARLQPITSVARLTADHFNNVTQAETAGGANSANITAVPWTLGDVKGFAVQSDGTILLVNPYSGATLASNLTPLGGTFGDAAMAPNGNLVAFQSNGNTDGLSSIFRLADTKTGLTFNLGGGLSGIQTFTTVNNNNVLSIVPHNVGYTFNGLTFFNQSANAPLMLFGVGSRGSLSFQEAPLDGAGNIIQPGPGPDGQAGTPDDVGDLRTTNTTTQNILWKLDPNNGAAINPTGVADRAGNTVTQGTGTQKVAFGRFNSTGNVTGLATIGTQLFAVSDTGQFFTTNLGSGDNAVGTINPSANLLRDPVSNALIQFSSLTNGPRDLFPNILFGTTINGTIYAISTTGVLQPVFPGAASFVRSATAAPSPTGFDFSPLGTNLWHTTTQRGNELGHGIDVPVDDSQANGRQPGDTSFYFGWERDFNAGTWTGNYDEPAYQNNYNLPGGAHGALESNPIDLRGISSADLPTLYFNYRLETEGKASNISAPDDDMQDSFRVYGAGDDGVWRLLVTNNSADNGNYSSNDAENEFDQGRSRNVDPFATPLSVQEAFDTAAWRQARVNLAAFAGNQNVRLRFEFSTAGTFYTNDPRFGGVELTAVEGSRINDGNTFTIATSDQAAADTATFEFDLGLVLDLPSAESIQDGVSQLNINGTSLTFRQGPAAAGFIPYSPTDSASQIAVNVRAALQAQLGLTVVTNSLRPNVLNVTGAAAPAGGTYTATSLPTSVIAGTPGVAPGRVAVAVTQAMTAVQVRDRVRAALAARFNAAGQANNVNVWPVYGNTIRMFRYTVNAAGPLQVATRSGDVFGNSTASALDVRSRQALNNRFSGLFLDDVVIGLAERGELVLNSTIVPQDTPTPASNLFSNNSGREYQPSGFVNSSQAPLSQIELGRYQVEIRLSAEYGNDKGGLSNLLDLGPPSDPRDVPPRVFGTNDRLTQSLGLDVSPAASISAGATFTLSDSVDEVTFEFDVRQSAGDTQGAGVTPGNIAVVVFANDSAAQVATKVRNAINSPTAQSRLKLSASVDGEMLAAPNADQRTSNSARVLLHGPAAITRTGGSSSIPAAGITIRRWGDESALGEDLGDGNRLRDQGMVIISQSSFTSSSQFGVQVDATRRVVPPPPTSISAPFASQPGSPISFPTINTDRLAPGVVIASNIFDRNLTGGILLSGDTAAAGDVVMPSTVARILNNTIVGVRSNDVGIRANEGAAPTIMNNIIARTQTGIDRAGAAGVTTVSANLYWDNVTNLSGGSESFALVAPASPFVANTSGGFYYPRLGSPAIDSSLDTLAELASLTQVKSTIGLPPSPALAPDRDVFGQRPLDDATASDTSGIGANVFKDRGAVERADSRRLQAIILQPQDNDFANRDVDRNNTFIQVNEGRFDFFSVLLFDGTGTGPDEATVVANAITLTENGRFLIPGADYVFGYDSNSHTVRLTPLAGIWRSDSVYEITLNNAAGRRVVVGGGTRFADGNTVRVNTAGGPLILELDSGTPAGITTAGAVRIPFSSSDTDFQIAAKLVAAINNANVGVTAYLQGDGTFMVVGATGVVFSNTNSGSVTTIGAIQDLAGNALDPNRATGLTQFTIVMPDVRLDYGDLDSSGVSTLKNVDGARHALLPIDIPRLALGRFADADTDGIPSPSASGDDTDSLVSLGTLGSTGMVTLGKRGAASFSINRALITDGQTFTITDTVAHPLTPVQFEFNTDVTATPGMIGIFVGAADTAQDVAVKMVAAIDLALKAGRLDNIIPVVDPASSGNVRLVANDGYIVDVDTAPALTRLATGNVDLVIPPSIATLNGTQFSITDGSGNLVRFQMNLYTPTPPLPIPPVSANHVAVNVDLTNATPATVATAIAGAINGQIALRNLVLGMVSASGSTVSILADDEDGVTFNGYLNSSSNDTTVTVQSTGAGMLDAWIDWNGDGDFADAREQFITNTPVQAGANVFSVQAPVGSSVGFVTARFRLSSLGSVLTSTRNTLTSGVLIGGEVEDYLVEVIDGAPPVAVADSYAVNEDSILSILTTGAGVLGNDTDPNNDPLAIPPIVEPIFVFDENPSTPAIDPLVNVANGTLVLNIDGTFTYTPNLDFNGTDRFVYNAVDRRLRSNAPATVTITVAPINDDPLAFDDSHTLREDEVVNLTGAFLTSNDLEHFRITNNPSNADNERPQNLTLRSASIVSDTSTNFGGIAGLNLRVAAKPGQGAYGIRLYVNSSDLGAGVAPTVNVVRTTITVTLNSNPASVSTVNDLIAAITGNAQANTLVSLTLTGSGTTPIGNVPNAYSPVVVPPSGGTQPTIVNNQLMYTPPANYNSRIGGPIILLVTIQDDALAGPVDGRTSTSRLTINITPVNDAPEFDWTEPKIETTVEDGGNVITPNFITGIRPGPVTAEDEGLGPTLEPPENQTVNFDPPRIRALRPELFDGPSGQPRIDASGTLTYRLAPDVNRITPFPTILVELIASDSGDGSLPNVNQTVARTFTILPDAVNDAPEFTFDPSTPALEDEGVKTVPNFMRGIRKGPTSALDENAQIFVDQLGNPTNFAVISADPNAFTATGFPTIDLRTGDLRFETAPHKNRFTGENFTITVTVIDNGGTALGGVDRTTKTFVIDVTELNDAPEYDMPTATSAFVEDPNAAPNAPTVVPNFITNMRPGPAAA
ncbi:MAG: Ig-like domain-containing protein, partial [Pirellulaceae bacterium]|nr:Ig-like domain-containing protein [Pirellulaceae bacterium]